MCNDTADAESTVALKVVAIIVRFLVISVGVSRTVVVVIVAAMEATEKIVPG